MVAFVMRADTQRDRREYDLCGPKKSCHSVDDVRKSVEILPPQSAEEYHDATSKTSSGMTS